MCMLVVCNIIIYFLHIGMMYLQWMTLGARPRITSYASDLQTRASSVTLSIYGYNW